MTLGLTATYKDKDSKIGQFLKLFFGLPLLKPRETEECYMQDLMPFKLNNTAVTKFCDYIYI